MPLFNHIWLALLIALMPAYAVQAQEERDREAVRTALEENYRTLDVNERGEVRASCNRADALDCTFFVPGWEPVTAVETGVITDFVTYIRLYQTTLFWQHWGVGFERIPVLAVVSGEGDELNVVYTLSHDFASVAPVFLAALEGTVIPNHAQLEFNLAIAELFASTSPVSEVDNSGRLEDSDDCVYTDLKRADWRRVVLRVVTCYDETGAVTRIEASRP